jgi:hypothetical protein
MYTVIGMDISDEEFERLRPILKNIEEGKRPGLKQGDLRIEGTSGEIVSIAISYLDKEMINRYCNGCPRLSPQEDEQSDRKEPHVCKTVNRIVPHAGEHPLLSTPDWCPRK